MYKLHFLPLEQRTTSERHFHMNGITDSILKNILDHSLHESLTQAAKERNLIDRHRNFISFLINTSNFISIKHRLKTLFHVALPILLIKYYPPMLVLQTSFQSSTINYYHPMLTLQTSFQSSPIREHYFT